MSKLSLTSRGFLIALAGAILSAGLVKAVAGHIQAVEKGAEMTLAAEGYDPRTLLSGHYAQMRYDINGFDPPSATGGEAPLPVAATRGWRPVFVQLTQTEDGWTVTQVARRLPEGAEGLWVRAQARGRGFLALRYGIERIYAQQKEAEALEALLRSQDDEVSVVVSFGDDRRLRLKGLIINGQRRDFAWW